ncbi:DUF2780 domain-containing protein [Labrenzia sp. PHM005]|uniref:DUF2780 domain-containing protein n=1 Tax=Labrenzia sp. PHM005 TaxID=2590016 RepID=UPI001140934C|nr:DUF2780 domain-containing protein [Labrenzia sp. PHM005]QDG78641.1 DUF2267 domain-containing protein [Labrenzia sp. PHM005]
MEELISRIVARAGVDETVAKDGLGIILGFLNKEAPAEKMQLVLDALPGAGDLLAARAGAASGGGLLGGLGSMMGGTMGAMAALNELNKAGLGMGEIQGLVKELVSYAKEKAGDDVVDEVIAKIPGLSQIV